MDFPAVTYSSFNKSICGESRISVEAMSETWLLQRAVQKRAKFQETGTNQTPHVEYLLQQQNMPFSKSKTSEGTQPPQISGNQNHYYQYSHSWFDPI